MEGRTGFETKAGEQEKLGLVLVAGLLGERVSQVLNDSTSYNHDHSPDDLQQKGIHCSSLVGGLHGSYTKE